MPIERRKILRNIMLDLETLGVFPGAAITSIGAVEFFDNYKLGKSFYMTIDIKDSLRNGFEIEAGALKFWLQQPRQARQHLWDDSASLVSMALTSFYDFVKDGEIPNIWGDGASFDNVLLDVAYKKIEMVVPWSYRQDRCYRTLRNLYPDIEIDLEIFPTDYKKMGIVWPDKFDAIPVEHNSFWDAVIQAEHACRLLAHSKR
jgi:3' exoribonuclease, RNase T-like